MVLECNLYHLLHLNFYWKLKVYWRLFTLLVQRSLSRDQKHWLSLAFSFLLIAVKSLLFGLEEDRVDLLAAGDRQHPFHIVTLEVWTISPINEVQADISMDQTVL